VPNREAGDRTRAEELAAWRIGRGASFAAVVVGDETELWRATETTSNDSNAELEDRRTASWVAEVPMA